MIMDFLDRSASGVTPMLVRLYDNHKLYSLAMDKRPAARSELTSIILDLVGSQLTPREEELVTDVLIGLVKQAETDLKQALAERLAVVENAPLRLILNLANEEISVAGEVLRQSPLLSDLDLVYIIKGKGADHWRAIAARNALGPQVIDMLAGTHDYGTAMALAENHKIRLTNYAFDTLSDIATEKQELATPLLNRDDVPSFIAAKLYKYVSEELRFFIKQHFNVDEKAFDRSFDDVVLEFVDPVRSSYLPTREMMEAAERMHKDGRLSIAYMVETLRRGQISLFMAQLANAAGTTVPRIEAMLKEQAGKELAIACRSIGMVKPDFITIYLLTQRVRSSNRIVAKDDLIRIISHYDRIDPEAARRFMRKHGH